MSVRRLVRERVKARGLNIKFPLKKGTDSPFEVNETTSDAVKDDLRILLLTNHGERIAHADFGANLRSLIFENMSQDLNIQIETAIFSAVEAWLPFVTIKEVKIKTGQEDPSLDPNEVRIKIFFSINSTNLDDELEITLQA